MTSQNTVSQPLTLRMNTGSPWIECHNDLTIPTGRGWRRPAISQQQREHR